MKLVELIMEVLENSESPLKQGEILSSIQKHFKYNDCKIIKEILFSLKIYKILFKGYIMLKKTFFFVSILFSNGIYAGEYYI